MIKQESGFTIVETLIVLAIAGLILLIVFLALPSLQRSSRNNQRNQDVQTVLQAVSHYELNNSGTLPNTFQLRLFLTLYYKNKLTFYTPANVTVCPTTPVVNPPYCSASDTVTTYQNLTYQTPSLDTMIIDNHGKCSASNNGDYTNQGAGYSDVVALFSTETGGAPSTRCQQL